MTVVLALHFSGDFNDYLGRLLVRGTLRAHFCLLQTRSGSQPTAKINGATILPSRIPAFLTCPSLL